METTRLPSRRRFLKGLGGAAVSAAALPAFCTTPPSRRPNILFIMSDDHAYQALSCYGSRINKTPNLDRLAAEGMRFDNYMVTNSICAPSRACILTGKYSHLNGKMTNNSTRYDPHQTNFPQQLQQAGYQTALFGKYHLDNRGEQPTMVGFDHYAIHIWQGSYFDPTLNVNGTNRQFSGHETDIVTDQTIAFLENRDAAKPFCVMCQFSVWCSPVGTRCAGERQAEAAARLFAHPPAIPLNYYSCFAAPAPHG